MGCPYDTSFIKSVVEEGGVKKGGVKKGGIDQGGIKKGGKEKGGPPCLMPPCLIPPWFISPCLIPPCCIPPGLIPPSFAHGKRPNARAADDRYVLSPVELIGNRRRRATVNQRRPQLDPCARIECNQSIGDSPKHEISGSR